MHGSHQHHHHDRHATLTTRAAIASVSMALFLLGLKGFAAWQTGSVSMLGSLADTALDVVASLVTLLGVRVAAMPADHDHRYGHGKAEALVALVQVALIAASAVGILIRAIGRLSSGAVTDHAEYGIGVSLIAMTATLVLLAYQRRVIAQTGSVAIAADHVHYQTDLLLNGAVIMALIADQLMGLTGADAVFGIAIALWLAWGAWRASSAAIDQLMDKEWPEDKRRRFIALAEAHPAVDGVHDLRTRSSGSRDFVQFCVWVDPHMSVLDAHSVMDEVEEMLMREFPGSEVLIHPEPRGYTEERGYVASQTPEHQGG